MIELIAIGFVAGVVAGISPCILPVLPVILAVGVTAPDDGGVEAGSPDPVTAAAVHPTVPSEMSVWRSVDVGAATRCRPGPGPVGTRDEVGGPSSARSPWWGGW